MRRHCLDKAGIEEGEIGDSGPERIFLHHM